MKNFVKIGGLLTLLATSAPATLFTYDFTGINAAIPDGNLGGSGNNQTVNLGVLPLDGTTAEIVDVNVRLNITGGYNGDLYGYLVHSSGFSVLLNRSGRTGADPFGYANTGFNITIDQSAANDIHNYQGFSPGYNGNGQVTGTWQQDGRTDDPLTTTESTANRNALLSNLNGLDANGTWTLFLMDASGGQTSTLVSWGLDIEVVPEPTTWALIGFGLGAAGFALRGVVRENFFSSKFIHPLKK